MKVVICWAGISGYMAACWRALAARGDVDPLILCFTGQKDTAFAEQSLTQGLNLRFLTDDRARSSAAVRDLIVEHGAQAVSVSGWIYPAFLEMARDPALAKVRFVMAMDTPFQNNWRQRVARLKLASYLRRMHRVMVAGERCWQYAKFLGVPEERIVRGTYGFDYNAFAHDRPFERARKFLFVGRYVEEKGIDVLMDAYALYRKSASNPWSLSCCGMGPLKQRVRGDGVSDLGFVQPADLPRVMHDYGVFVLPSRYEPWGVVVAEAAAAGMAILCSEAVGASVELVRDRFNGLTFATGGAGALAAGMSWFHEHSQELGQMAARSSQMAGAYAAELWAQRWQQAFAGSDDVRENA